MPEQVPINSIDDSLRVRQDYGDLSSLKYSIKEFGIIQPIVLIWDANRWTLIAGGRRLKAMRELGFTELTYGKEYILRDDLEDYDDPKIRLRRKTIEMEENLKRKDMTWQEQVIGKQTLLQLMQEIHGVRGDGPPVKGLDEDPAKVGFSQNKLAAMLGEGESTTHQDIQLAQAMSIVPDLAKMDTKTAAFARVQQILKTMQARKAGIIPVTATAISYRVLVHVPDEQGQITLIEELESRGYKAEPVII